jgi:3-oxoacyl-[acyl-carrier protein] reductase
MAEWQPEFIRNLEIHEGEAMKLKGKVALITGGASGLGESIAQEFAREGASVAVADLNLKGATGVAEQIGSKGSNVFALQVDVADPSSINAGVDNTIKQLGPIDILVNSAGIARLKPFLETSIEDYDLVHNINVRGTFVMAQAVARTMVGRGGNIINISSASGRRGNYGRTAYGPGKAAIIRLTEIMAVELAAHHIRVNVLAPGPIETPIVAAQLTEAGKQSWTAVVPMNRWGRPIEIAMAALFLASEDSSFVTGHCLDVDGGFYAGGILRL